MKKLFLILFALIAGTFAFTNYSFAEEDFFDLLGGLGEENQAMEEEEVSTATAIRGLNPVAEKYGANQRNLSQYIRDVKIMEQRRMTKRELQNFLMEEGLGSKRSR